MAYDDLRGFISALERAGELKRISFEVDPYLEIAEFADRSVKKSGPAFLFEKPKDSSIPVLINAFASMKRMQLALGVDSVEVPMRARQMAWQKLAGEWSVDLAKIVTEVSLEELNPKIDAILKGAVRGRVLVDLSN